MTAAVKRAGKGAPMLAATHERLLDALWSLRALTIQLSVPGFVGIALLIGAGWIHWVAEPEGNRRIAVLEAESANLRLRPAPRVDNRPPPVEIFREQIETHARFAAVLDDVTAALKSANVTLVEATVTTPNLKDLPGIGRIDLAVTARGSYAAVKSSIGTLLARHPGLGLEQMTLEKNESGSVLDARLRFAYFYRT